MAVNLSIKQFVIISISIIALIFSIVLVIKVTEFKSVLHLITFPLPEYKTKIQVIPESSQQGTIFLITADYPLEREQQDLGLKIQSGTYSTSILLYDNGKNQDKEANDGIYAGIFDSENKPLGLYEIKSEEGVLASFRIYEPGCEPIIGSSNDDRINFVILPSGYDNYEEFKKDAKSLLTGKDSLLEIEPFKPNKNKFSFSIINTTRDLECQIGCKNVPTIVCCNNKAVSEEASRCHYDSILVLVNNDSLCGSASYYAKICSKNSLSKLALVHEIGHSFADLADEYVYSEQYGSYDIGEINAVNCDKEKCEKWQNITDGCYKGCTYGNLYRPAQDESIMYRYVPIFNSVSKEHIINLIKEYEANEKTMERDLPLKKSYFVNTFYSNGNLKIENAFVKPVKANILKKGNYEIKIKSIGRLIFSESFSLPLVIYPLPETNSTAIVLNETEFSLILPFSSEADNLEITKDNKTIDKISLAAFADTCGNNICENYENKLSCSADCKIKDNFCQTSKCDPDCPSQKNCQKKTRFLLFLGIIILITALIVIIITIIKVRKKK